MNDGNTKDKIEFAADWAGDGFLLAARRLREIQDKKPEAFAAVAQYLGVRLRKAYYLAQIDRTFDTLGVSGNRLAAIGWSKVRLLCDYITPENAEDLLGLAEISTVRELKLFLKQQLPVPGTRAVLLYLEPAQYDLFEKVLLAHGAIKVGRGLIDKEPALIQALAAVKD